MCLIVIAHRASSRFPFVLAANRDEEYERPSRAAHFWDAAPDILGGRDARHGGSWLAVTRRGRFAAITNIRGGEKPEAPSRGGIVAAFVRSTVSPADFIEGLAVHDYAGFHLIAGEIGQSIVHLSNADGGAALWPDGVHGISNAPPGTIWPKVERATARVDALIRHAMDSDSLAHSLLDFLGEPGVAARWRGSTLREEIENEIFVMSDRYGTRSSTAIVVSGGELRFFEQNYGRGGERLAEVRRFFFPME